MYIEIDNLYYYFHLEANLDQISVSKITDEAIHLQVPARMSQAELKSYIKCYAHNFKLQAETTDFIDKKISMFEMNYQLLIMEGVKHPYINGAAIMLPINFKINTAKLKQLKEDVFLNEINKLISFWEEKLNVLIPPIKLRKLQTNTYYNCHNTNFITVNRILADKPKNLFNLIIADLVFAFSKINEEDREQLLDNHVKDWKHLQKILAYERNIEY